MSARLQAPRTRAGRIGLERALARPERTLLATDYDGTLAPIVEDPDRARPHPDAVRVLGRLAARLGGVAVVTGRPVRDVLRLGGFAEGAGLTALRILGQYGVERWDATTGDVDAPEPHPGIDRVRADLPALLAGLDLADVHLEDKGRAVGLHVRRLRDPDAALAALRGPVQAMAAEHGLVVEPGKQVLELRAPGVDKGAAIENLLAGTDLDTVVFAGDDLGDRAAFDAVDRLRAGGGAGVLLFVHSADVGDLAELADLVFDRPGALVAWLDAVADALEETGPVAGR